jgi:DNA-binding NarL/FixJ family response regulator
MGSRLTAPVRLSLTDVGRPVAESPGTDPFPARPPSERETQIICLAALGLTNAEVARRLHISRHTVAQHLSQILRECGAHSRCELVARAYAAGILGSWPPRRIG